MPPRINRTDPDFADRFWSKVDVREPDECWPWLKGLNNGYGTLGFERRVHAAHRVAYELGVGPIPDGLLIDHTCHSTDMSCPGGLACMHRRCVNPRHLEPMEFAVKQAGNRAKRRKGSK